MILGIIGTAARGEDYDKITHDLWSNVRSLVFNFIREHNIESICSGGAAYSDSLAVELFCGQKTTGIKELYLYLPCKFDLEKGRYVDNGERSFIKNPGGISNYYHDKYNKFLGRKNSLTCIQKAIKNGAIVEIGNGFFHRNTSIALKSDILLAITFGDKEFLKDGGTSDTMKKFLKLESKGSKFAYHLNLNDLKIYKEAKVY